MLSEESLGGVGVFYDFLNLSAFSKQEHRIEEPSVIAGHAIRTWGS